MKAAPVEAAPTPTRGLTFVERPFHTYTGSNILRGSLRLSVAAGEPDACAFTILGPPPHISEMVRVVVPEIPLDFTGRVYEIRVNAQSAGWWTTDVRLHGLRSRPPIEHYWSLGEAQSAEASR